MSRLDRLRHLRVGPSRPAHGGKTVLDPFRCVNRAPDGPSVTPQLTSTFKLMVSQTELERVLDFATELETIVVERKHPIRNTIIGASAVGASGYLAFRGGKAIQDAMPIVQSSARRFAATMRRVRNAAQAIEATANETRENLPTVVGRKLKQRLIGG